MKKKRVVKMNHGRWNALIHGLMLISLLMIITESGMGQSLQSVSARPGRTDPKTGRPLTAGGPITTKPAGVDRVEHSLTATSGMGRALVILIEFPDQRATGTHTPSLYTEMLFSTNTYPTGSMHDYYMENSYGAFGLSGDVTRWYMAPQPYAFYVNGCQGFGKYPTNAQKLMEDAVGLANGDVDFSRYDADGNGSVDALFIIHSGPGAEETGHATDIWSHVWGPSSVITADGVTISSYAMEPEEHDDGAIISIGVFCHEMGHILGLPDLYDCDYSSDGIGNFGLMGSGSWGGDGRSPERPVHLCAWSKVKLGWINPVRVTTDLFERTIRAIETTPEVYRLWTNGSAGTEYFLVSNRRKTGFDSKLPGSGLLIWHIDESNWHNNDESHRLVDLEEADGAGHLDVYADFNRGDSGDFFPGKTGARTFDDASQPGSRNTAGFLTGVSVRSISDAASVMTADLHVTGTSYPDIELSAAGFDFGTVSLGASENRTLDISNTGTGALTISAITASQGCVTLSPTSFPRTVSPGGLFTVNLTYTPATAGPLSGQVSIFSNDPTEQLLHVTVTGAGQGSSGVPSLTLLSTDHTFGQIALGESEDWTFHIYNTGDGDLVITSVTSDEADFALTTQEFPRTVDPGDMLAVTATFQPSEPGERTGHLSICSNDGQVPADISMTGTGLAPEVSVSPSRIEKTLWAFDTSPVELFIKNHGNQVLSFEIFETAPWLELETLSGTVSEASTVSVTGTIDPSHLSSGQNTSDILILTSDPQHAATVIPVTVLFDNAVISVGSSISYGFPSDTNRVPIEMDNLNDKNAPVSGVQAELYFDSDVFVPVEVSRTGRSQSMGSLFWSSPEPGRIIVLLSDTQGHSIAPGTGPIAHVHFGMADSVQAGQSFWITFGTVVLSDERGISLPVSTLAGLVIVGCKGDMNCDGCINIVDLIHVVNIILGNTVASGAELWAADYNCDGTVNVMDIIDMVGNICSTTPQATKSEPAMAEISLLNIVSYSETEWTVPVAVSSSSRIAGLQLDIACDSRDWSPDRIVPAEPYSHMEVVWVRREGSIRIILFSPDNAVISAPDGPVVYLVGRRGDGSIETNTLDLRDILLVDAHGESIPVTVVEKPGTNGAILPDDFVLMQNVPNPFNPTTDISYQLSAISCQTSTRTTLKIYNMLGQEIRTLVDAAQGPGAYTVQWDGRDRWEKAVSSGLYMYALQAGSRIATQKMTLLK